MPTKISVTKKLTVTADSAWQALSSIGRLDVWFPSITACDVEGTGSGATRRMRLSSGGVMVDKILEVNHSHRRVRYERVELPLPVSSYRGTVEVFSSFDACAVVVWTVDFETRAEANESIATLLKTSITAGVDGLERDLVARAQ